MYGSTTKQINMRNRNKIISIFIIFLLSSNVTYSQTISRDLLIEDARQMIKLVESCHPDPYINTGGKIGFHMNFQQMLSEIPSEGMSASDFWWSISGFLAKLKDGHTYPYALSQPDSNNPQGIPFKFSIMSDSVLVVSRVYNRSYEQYLGSCIIKINNIEVETLLHKVAALYPMENYFDRFRNLKVYLWYGDYLKRLLPGWNYGDSVQLDLLNKNNKQQTVTVSTNEKVNLKLAVSGTSSLELPNTKKCDFVFDWIGKENDIAYLRINKQDEFREYAEQLIDGLKNIQNQDILKAYRQQYMLYAQKWHERYHGNTGPDSLELLVKQLPSFTEFMVDVTKELKKNSSKELIIDLRNNSGGISLISDILIYFLFGKQKLAELHNDSYDITYLSPLAVEKIPSFNTDQINKKRGAQQNYLLHPDDYDLFSMSSWENRQLNESNHLLPASNYKTATTFFNEYESGKHEAFYTPEQIFVIADDNTFSAGFETLVRLIKCNAVFIGVPPAQSGNCFGMAIEPVNGLKNSKVRINISTKKIFMFPDNKELGYQLNPDISLDYNTFKRYNYDRNTPIILSIEKIENKNY